mmetsp:Transcript_8299/g.15472  ORF Transcript_8299/g.15472 Transcript_8299/m.15472 type:complete len:360 (-) Transcript_8299:46-1125(-)
MADEGVIKDELTIAAETGNLQKLQRLFGGGVYEATSRKAQSACLSAANAKQAQAVIAFLQWGISPNIEDNDKNRLLFVCMRRGLDTAVTMLIEKGVDLKRPDTEGNLPMAVAIKSKNIPIIKELLRAGVDVPHGQLDAPGLAAAAHEVKVEQSATSLRANAGQTIDLAEVAKVEKEVWSNMKEHMRLLRIKEEGKAGSVLVELERKTAAEKTAAEAATAREAQLAIELKDQKVLVAAAESELHKVAKELGQVEATLADAKIIDLKVQAELAEQHQKLQKEQAVVDAFQKARLEAEAHSAKAFADLKAIEAEVAEARIQHDQVDVELNDAREDLEGWLRDKDAAAALTAQAHRLLGLSAA